MTAEQTYYAHATIIADRSEGGRLTLELVLTDDRYHWIAPAFGDKDTGVSANTIDEAVDAAVLAWGDAVWGLELRESKAAE